MWAGRGEVNPYRVVCHKRLVCGGAPDYLAPLSTVAEIESAIEHLPASEARRLLDRLLAKSLTNGFAKPKTGAELARLWPVRFHLQPAEAEALAADLDEARVKQATVRPLAGE